MRYVGGKSKMARHIAQVILSRETARESYVEPFVGGGSILAHMAPNFQHSQAIDLSPDIILMWQAVMDGWEPPGFVSESEYAALKNSPPSALRGFVGFGGSFGGKWFGGYARGGFQANGEPRNYQAESARAVDKIKKSITGVNVSFVNADYGQATVSPGAVVYCDPPYSGTETYKAVEPFDSEAFWRTARQWAEVGASVYVSEYAAPAGWQCVWARGHRGYLAKTDSSRKATTERLFSWQA